MDKLKPCPCGKTPAKINIDAESHPAKWAFGIPDCCGEWIFEMRLGYETDPIEQQDIAIQVWNLLPRADKTEESDG